MERFGQICPDQRRIRDAEEKQISNFNKIQIHIIQIQVIKTCTNDKWKYLVKSVWIKEESETQKKNKFQTLTKYNYI